MKFVNDTALPDALAHPRPEPAMNLLAWTVMTERRRLLIRLVGSLPDDDAYRIGQLVDIIALYETEGRVDHRERKSVYVNLTQNDLPNLDRHGVLRYDDTAKTVRSGPLLPLASDVLDGIEGALASANVEGLLPSGMNA